MEYISHSNKANADVTAASAPHALISGEDVNVSV